MARARYPALVAVILAPVLACGTFLSTIPEGATDGDGGTPEASVTPHAPDGTVVVEAAVPCLPPPDEANAIHVTATTTVDAGFMGTDLTCGSTAEPCSLATALSRADGAGGVRESTTIDLGPGEYPINVVVPAHTHLVGGWTIDAAGTWARTCAPGLVTLAGGTNAAVVSVSDAPDVTIERVNLRSTRVSAAGESRFGIVARGATTQVALVDVHVTASPGGDGTPGAAAPPSSGALDCSPSDGAPGGPGPQGDPVALVLDDKGVHPSAGGQGGPGIAGRGGMYGVLPVPQGGTACVLPDGVTPTCQGCVMMPKPGAPGCGGAGGIGGAPGMPGGASVAVFAMDGAVVQATLGRFEAGAGGKGGEGGMGSAGTGGTAGGSGAPDPSCVFGCTCPASTDPPSFVAPGPAGGPGTAGGPGGPGGTGGGAAGGASYASAAIQNARVVTANTVLSAGAGGAGGAPNGAPGASGEHL